jgi:type II secretory pathway pseudopilin PulG
MSSSLREEAGFTLVELMITMAMMVMVVVVFLSVFWNVNQGVATQRERSIANDQARLAIENLDREIRSGNVIYDPAVEDEPGYGFRIYSQSNAPTRSSSIYTNAQGFTCVEWAINDDEELVRRFWKPGTPTVFADWRVLAENVVNKVPGIDQPAFTVDTVNAPRTVVITLMVDTDTAETVSRPVRIQTSITGRNTTVGFPSTVCDPGPA